jgi:antitoxin ParD1/3/4/toxin ParE1/3/4
VLAPQAARDVVQIWRYINREVSREAADRIESVIRTKCIYLATFPDAGHWRHDLTSADVRFFSVYSYLIVYRPETKPLQVVTILHASRDVAGILSEGL